MPSTKAAVEGLSQLDLARNTLEQVVKIKNANEYSPEHVRVARFNAWRCIVDQTPMTDEAKRHYLAFVDWLYGEQPATATPTARGSASSGYCASKWAGV